MSNSGESREQREARWLRVSNRFRSKVGYLAGCLAVDDNALWRATDEATIKVYEAVEQQTGTVHDILIEYVGNVMKCESNGKE